MLQHIADDVGLRNRLTAANRKRVILKGFLTDVFRYKLLARHFSHSLQNPPVGYASSLDLIVNHAPAPLVRRLAGNARLQAKCQKGDHNSKISQEWRQTKRQTLRRTARSVWRSALWNHPAESRVLNLRPRTLTEFR